MKWVILICREGRPVLRWTVGGVNLCLLKLSVPFYQVKLDYIGPYNVLIQPNQLYTPPGYIAYWQSICLVCCGFESHPTLAGFFHGINMFNPVVKNLHAKHHTNPT